MQQSGISILNRLGLAWSRGSPVCVTDRQCESRRKLGQVIVVWRCTNIMRIKFYSNRIEGLGATYAVHLRLIGKLIGDFLLVIIELFLLGAFVLSQCMCLTDGQTSIARCESNEVRCAQKWWTS